MLPHHLLAYLPLLSPGRHLLQHLLPLFAPAEAQVVQGVPTDPLHEPFEVEQHLLGRRVELEAQRLCRHGAGRG